ncbi:hypothetical protein ACWDRX_35270, partial [Streptomyces nigra]
RPHGPRACRAPPGRGPGTLGTASLPWSVLVLLLPTLAVVAAAHTHGFPATARAGGAVSSE